MAVFTSDDKPDMDNPFRDHPFNLHFTIDEEGVGEKDDFSSDETIGLYLQIISRQEK
jgi:hypothetical protein